MDAAPALETRMIIGDSPAIRLELKPGAVVPVGALLMITIVRFGLWQGLAASALFVLSLLAHEAGHIAVAQFYGKRVAAVGLGLKGAYTRRERAEGSAELAISFAGPALNLAFAIVLTQPTELATWFGQVNLALAVFNLLPFAGSDGQRMLAILSNRTPANKTADTTASARPNEVPRVTKDCGQQKSEA